MSLNEMRLIDILLIEDNEGDILLTSEALEESEIPNNLSVIKDGEAAIEYFENNKNSSALPDLILLDINLPKKSGHEVLVFLKASELLKHIPVIMLTTSSSQKDILLGYKNHVNCYLVKPLDVLNFKDIVSKIETFWINVVASTPKN